MTDDTREKDETDWPPQPVLAYDNDVGFLERDNGQRDLFFHASGCTGGLFASRLRSDHVRYEEQEALHGMGPRAVTVDLVRPPALFL